MAAALVVVAAAIGSNLVVPIKMPSSTLVLAGTAFVGKARTKMTCYYNFSADAVSTFPSTVLGSSSLTMSNESVATDAVYAYYQTAAHTVSGTITYSSSGTQTMRMAISELVSDVSLVVSRCSMPKLFPLSQLTAHCRRRSTISTDRRCCTSGTSRRVSGRT